MKRFHVIATVLLTTIAGAAFGADMDGLLFYNGTPNMVGQTSGVYAWGFSPGVIWKAPFANAAAETRGLEVSYNTLYENFSVINSTLVWPFPFGTISAGFMNVGISGMTVANSQIGVNLGYGLPLLDRSVMLGVNLQYFNYRVETYSYDMSTLSFGLAYSCKNLQIKFVRPLEVALNVVDIGIYSSSSAGAVSPVLLKGNLAVRYDIMNALYIPDNKLFAILNVEYTGDGVLFAGALCYTLKDAFQAMVSYDGDLSLGVGVTLLGVSISYWIDPGLGTSLGISQRIGVSVDFDKLGSGQAMTTGGGFSSDSVQLKLKQRDDMYAEAVQQYNDGKFAESIKTLNALMEIDPNYPAAIDLMKKAGEALDNLIKEKEKNK